MIIFKTEATSPPEKSSPEIHLWLAAPLGWALLFTLIYNYYNERRSDKGVHVDGWKAIKRADGTVKVAKKWATY